MCLLCNKINIGRVVASHDIPSTAAVMKGDGNVNKSGS